MDYELKTLFSADPLFKKANSSARFSKNVKGKWYVDDSCVDCDLCGVKAPKVFKRDNGEGQYYVAKQPTEAELAACNDAKAHCPVHAIHNS